MSMQSKLRSDSTDQGDISSPVIEGKILEAVNQPKNLLVCHEWDNTIRWRPGERLHHLFEHRCDQFIEEKATNHRAVDSTEGTWTYSELDARANQLARYLKLQGLGPGDIVGLLFDKSVNSYASMLAILKIHAAYVPLDPAFPEERIAFIADDAGLCSILTVSPYHALVEATRLPVICVDTTSAQIDSQQTSRLGPEDVGQPVNELCYIIYTSGSTGRPKGVPIEHASIVNFVRVAAEVYDYRHSDRVYQGLTIAFDFAVEEIWVPLVVGATLLPNQTGSSLLGSDLADFLLTNKATAMCCVPTLLATIDAELPDLRLLIVSGEACPKDLITRWYSDKRTILNAYGPTEATVTATLARSKPDQPVTIGKPLPTYSIVILEPGTEQVLPIGETGEICIAGIGLARGYLNREEQTRKAFIRDFLNIPNNPSGLIYRTGDLGRINENGDIEYRGRIDTQVKIRGYRIELSEIESVILNIPQIAQTVVETFEPLPGVKELVAYYTLKDDVQALPQDEIVNELRSLLPNYMVPAFYEQLPIMPMLASDKADRKALPKPSGRRMNAEYRTFVAPETPLENDIAAILCRLLKLEDVSVVDNFFDDLGANSLLMAEFSARLRSELGIVDFSMREIYTHPNVRELSASLKSTDQQPAPLHKTKTSHTAKDWEYILSGAAQLVLVFAWICLELFIFWLGYHYIMEASDTQAVYARSALFALIWFGVTALLPVVLKWVLIGRWKEDEFPVWSLKYLRFWTIKQLVRLNPMALFVGTPLYTAYLKLLGARISWNSIILSPHVPVCTDLISIGDGSIVSKNAAFSGYRADSSRIRTGSVRLERENFVGVGAVLDIDTVMEAGSELAHASSLHMGQRLTAGCSYHGSPAQLTDNRYRRLAGSGVGRIRMILFSLAQLALPLMVYLPIPFLVAHQFFGASRDDSVTTISEAFSLPATLGQLPAVIGWTSLAFLASVLFGLLLVVVLPRCLAPLLKVDRVYSLYGIHYFIYRNIERLSNAKFYNTLFGDSSFIVHYLQAIGYRFRGMEQTGSNFGLSQQHENPFQCEIGKGTMVSDGLAMFNGEYSTASFKFSKISVGAHNFFGNSILVPTDGKVGDNCLLGTKVMIPTNGSMRENVGLLGSPCFEIPRSVRRDSKFDFYKRKDVLRQRLRLKNASNAITMGLFLLSNGIAANLATLTWFYTHGHFIEYEILYLALLTLGLAAILIPYYIFVDWASLGFRRLQAQYCSIYDDYFWRHERYWKLGMSSDQPLFGILNGTPFKSLVWRALGVRVGKKLFDDGCSITEKTLVTIGDHCTLNEHSTVQSHSLEDGTFKSDHIMIGDGCTVGANCYVHYGVQMQDEVTLEPDSFLMKGERPEARTIWQGNPAKEMLVAGNQPAHDLKRSLQQCDTAGSKCATGP